MQPENPSQPPPYQLPPYQQPPPYPPQKSGMPVWAWILIGCAGGGCVLFVIIAAIMFPVFSQARESARGTSCLSNIKQINLGMMMYVQDYDEVFPHTADWKGATTPYIKSESVYHCPSVSGPNATATSPYGYAFNSELLSKKLADISDPRTTKMFFESSNLEMNAADPVISLPSPGRHRGINNIGFADGHATRGDRPSGGGMP